MKPSPTARKRFWKLQLWQELITAARFGLVGVFATAVHITLVWVLLRHTATPPLVANTLAFLTAFGVSFSGNYWWTFRSPGHPRRAMYRFFLISGSAFLINTLVLALLLQAAWLPPHLAAVCSASLVPVLSYLASRLWGFKGTTSP